MQEQRVDEAMWKRAKNYRTAVVSVALSVGAFKSQSSSSAESRCRSIDQLFILPRLWWLLAAGCERSG